MFGNNVKSIGERAFYSCNSLTKVELPSTIETVGNYAFYKCTSLKQLSMERVSVIGDYAFFGCTSLTDVNLPATVTSIGSQAFRNCGMTSVVLSSTVKSVGNHAFYGCNNLTIYSDAEQPLSGWGSSWNSAYRPVVWGCTLGSDGAVVSFVYDEDSIDNLHSENKLSDPYRKGYKFSGWAVTQDGKAQYQSADLQSVEYGTELFAVWEKI